ncbi:hypothetical protein TRIUR3_08240 [Triticum urartu]|uniref:Uncharacterized protein n=2 Tax=Triticum TaxID=4564 RepID=A0A9R0Y841_TRITD|nr:hypothetical protein TRIUR3_08240 [Triticum urartu]VAI49897.1 unnamed protein product [Triticum turgidum subsp. durum]
MDAKRTAVGRASVTALVTACVTVVAYALATAAEYALDRYHLCSQVTMVRHCMCARAFLLPLAADPEYLVGTICIGFTFCFAANDVANFVHFLRGGDN